MKPQELEVLGPYFETAAPAVSGEWRMHCPFHGEDRNASASLNVDKRIWSCRKCMDGGTVSDLVRRVAAIPAAQRRKPGATVISMADRSSTKGEPEYLHEGLVQMWHEALMEDSVRRANLRAKRGITDETIRRFKIGWCQTDKRRRYTIPIYDDAGALVNVRFYSMSRTAKHKLINSPGHGSPPRLYPIDQLQGEEVLLVEGEWDALVCIQNGFAAVSGTHGARTWHDSWTPYFAGKDVFISYDNDEEGAIGAQLAANSISSVAESVAIVPALLPAENSDATDYFKQGGTAEDLRSKLEAAKPVKQAGDRTKLKPVPANVAHSLSAKYLGTPLQLNVSIVGRVDPPFDLPKELQLSCPMDQKTKCQNCAMAEWGGYQEVEFEVFDEEDVSMLTSVVTGSKTEREQALRKRLNIYRRCPTLKETITEHYVGEELFVQSVPERAAMEETDRTKRRVFYVSDRPLPVRVNTSASLVGLNVTNATTGRMDFVSWDLQEAITNIDTFEMTPELYQGLRIFQPRKGQRPLSKCREIAFDLSRNVTTIWDRERMHIAMDLVWHSVLNWKFQGELQQRGWLELLIVGDTRTGKSQAAQHLAEHYQTGRIINCERTSVAGLIGGVNKISDRHVITWGDLPLNDRRLAVLDEASGLSHEIIAQMSDVRTRGIAQIVKIETAETTARVRLIWISNPRPGRDGPRASYRNILGINMVQELIGNPEDIARFDFAMSVSADDVPDVNDMRDHVPHVFTSDLCHQLVVWAWSRRPENVKWAPGVEDHVLACAKKFGRMYEPAPPLVQATDVRKKVARLAVAIAARTFSTDDGENLLVKQIHVDDACRFLDTLYSYQRFGYKQLSQDQRRNRQLAHKSRKEIVSWFKTSEGKVALEFLHDQNQASFRPQDLYELYQNRFDGEDALRKLMGGKMLRRRKSQLEMEPELLDILRELREL